jgi:hypothetical protein
MVQLRTPPWPSFHRMTNEEFESKFVEHSIDGDGNCQFRCFALGILEDQSRWQRVKQSTLDHFEKHPEQLHAALEKHPDKVKTAMEILHTNGAYGDFSTSWLVQLKYQVGVYVWEKPNPKSLIPHFRDFYHMLTKPHPDIERPRKVFHILYDTCNQHYTFLEPNKNYVAGPRRPRPSSAASICTVDLSLIADIITEEDGAKSCGSDAEPMGVRLSIDSLALSNGDADDETLLDMSLDSFASSRSRPSNETYAEQITRDVIGSVKKGLVKTKQCCDRGCLLLESVPNHPTIKHIASKIFQNPERSLDVARHFMAAKSQSERSEFVRTMIAGGAHQDADGKQDFHFFVEELCGDDLAQVLRTEVCSLTFRLFYGLTERMVQRAKKGCKGGHGELTNSRARTASRNRVLSEQPTTEDLSERELVCLTFIRTFCEDFGEKLPTGGTQRLRIAFEKKYVYEQYKAHLTENPNMGRPFAKTKFYELWSDHCADVMVCKGKGDFAVCDFCKSSMLKICNPRLSSADRMKVRAEFKQHMATVQASKKSYYRRIGRAIEYPHEFVSIIIDGCDSNTTVLPNVANKSKSQAACHEAFLKHRLMGVRVHFRAHRNYLYLMPPWAAEKVGVNLTLEALSRTLVHEARWREEHGFSWPKTLYLQLDNTSKDNKNVTMFAFASYLVQQGIFEEAFLNFLPVGHTHEDIDQVFSVISRKLAKASAYTYPEWQHVVANAYNDPIDNPASIEYIWTLNNFRAWLEKTAVRAYSGFRSEAYHFKVALDHNRVPVTQYLMHDYMAEEDAPYSPRDCEPPSFLPSPVRDFPSEDLSHGTWAATKKDQSSLKVVDKDSFLVELTKLMRLQESREQSPDALTWWQHWLEQIPPHNEPIDDDRYWPFTLPDIQGVLQKTPRPPHVSIAADVGKTPAPQHDLLLTTYYSKRNRAEIRTIYDVAHKDEIITINVDDIVASRVDDDWKSLGAEQEGLTQLATSLPFTLGKVVEAQDDADSIKVIVYYCRDGNPNSKWTPWVHATTTKTKHWIKEIPRASVYLAGLEFTSAGKHSKTLTTKSMQAMSRVPSFPFTYIPNAKLVPWEAAHEMLQNQLGDLPAHPTNKKDHNRRRRLENELRHLGRKKSALDRIVDEKMPLIIEADEPGMTEDLQLKYEQLAEI